VSAPGTIADRLAAVRAKIPAGVTLVAVSKGQPVEAIREAYGAGQRHFGENYAQEWRDKAAALADLPEVVWHFIGGLQTNKAKYLAGGVRYVHTVDREELAAELGKRCAAKGATLEILVEVNIGREPQKSGVLPEALPPLLRAAAALPALKLAGLMCIPPAEGDPRPHFAALRRLRDEIRVALGWPLGLRELSMGMSGDYPIAIEEGATMVRVGTAIFGERKRVAWG
jgi:pyridoxal phosphate enzyme (YggS family)